MYALTSKRFGAPKRPLGLQQGAEHAHLGQQVAPALQLLLVRAPREALLEIRSADGIDRHLALAGAEGRQVPHVAQQGDLPEDRPRLQRDERLILGQGEVAGPIRAGALGGEGHDHPAALQTRLHAAHLVLDPLAQKA